MQKDQEEIKTMKPKETEGAQLESIRAAGIETRGNGSLTVLKSYS